MISCCDIVILDFRKLINIYMYLIVGRFNI